MQIQCKERIKKMMIKTQIRIIVRITKTFSLKFFLKKEK